MNPFDVSMQIVLGTIGSLQVEGQRLSRLHGGTLLAVGPRADKVLTLQGVHHATRNLIPDLMIAKVFIYI
jgi:hypothetical protein